MPNLKPPTQRDWDKPRPPGEPSAPPAPMQGEAAPPAQTLPPAGAAHAAKAPDDVIRFRRLLAAISEIGGCLTDLGIVAVQGLTVENEARRGNIALGLERAAAYVRGQPFAREPDPQHAEREEARPSSAGGTAT